MTASVFCCCKILLGINGIYHKFVSNQESLIPQYLRSWLCGLKSCHLLIQFYLKGTLIYAYNVHSIAKRELQTRTTEEVSPIGFLAKKIKTHDQTSKYREVKRELLYYKQAYIWFSFWEPQINTKRRERLLTLDMLHWSWWLFYRDATMWFYWFGNSRRFITEALASHSDTFVLCSTISLYNVAYLR